MGALRKRRVLAAKILESKQKSKRKGDSAIPLRLLLGGHWFRKDSEVEVDVVLGECKRVVYRCEALPTVRLQFEDRCLGGIWGWAAALYVDDVCEAKAPRFALSITAASNALQREALRVYHSLSLVFSMSDFEAENAHE